MSTIGRQRIACATLRSRRRSARRQTVRATWSAAAFGVPPGRMNARSGSSSASPSSIARSSSRDARVVDARLLEMLAHLVADRAWRGARRGEEIALDGDEHLVDARHGLDRAGHAERRVQLVDVAVGLDARMILRNAAAAEESRVAGVTGLRVDLHGIRIYPDWRSRPLEHPATTSCGAGRPRARRPRLKFEKCVSSSLAVGGW